MLKKLIALALALVLALSFSACNSEKKKEQEAAEAALQLQLEEEAKAKERIELISKDQLKEDPVVINTKEELMAIPSGSSKNFKLGSDIDLAGESWKPIDFCGSFDGAEHKISNLSVESFVDSTRSVFDGNMKEYETHFAGMFGVLSGAEVKNLSLENISINVTTDTECIFTGCLTGFMENSLIDGVSITGNSYLKTNSKCFGVGGIAGYGNGEIRNSAAAVTLVCIDSNKEEKDEQFMGGAYAAGAIDLNSNTIAIDGYDSDHGYVHNGGLVGMYIHYYKDCPKGSICDNSVSGRIKFFEDNRDRRAYCEPYVGEMMNWNLAMTGNTNAFTRDEVFEYHQDLLPEKN